MGRMATPRMVTATTRATAKATTAKARATTRGDDEGDDEGDDGEEFDEFDEFDQFDDEPSLIVRGPAGFSILVERADPDLLRLLRTSSERSSGEVHLVIAQRHATEPPPAMARLAGAVRLQLDVV